MYETTLTDTESSLVFKYIVLPSRSIPKTKNPVTDNLAALGLKDPIPISTPLIPLVLTALLVSEEANNVRANLAELFTKESMNVPFELMRSDAYLFAEHLAFSRVVPFEQSPLELDSIVNLVTNASGVSVGAYVGFVTVGVSPLLFLTVPAGMILCGAAAGVAKALEEGLQERLMSLLMDKSHQNVSDGTASERTQGASSTKTSETPAKRERRENTG